jgi:hypothetical protein
MARRFLCAFFSADDINDVYYKQKPPRAAEVVPYSDRGAA